MLPCIPSVTRYAMSNAVPKLGSTTRRQSDLEHSLPNEHALSIIVASAHAALAACVPVCGRQSKQSDGLPQSCCTRHIHDSGVCPGCIGCTRPLVRWRTVSRPPHCPHSSLLRGTSSGFIGLCVPLCGLQSHHLRTSAGSCCTPSPS